jgi:hypothetical protein
VKADGQTGEEDYARGRGVRYLSATRFDVLSAGYSEVCSRRLFIKIRSPKRLVLTVDEIDVRKWHRM